MIFAAFCSSSIRPRPTRARVLHDLAKLGIRIKVITGTTAT